MIGIKIKIKNIILNAINALKRKVNPDLGIALALLSTGVILLLVLKEKENDIAIICLIFGLIKLFPH